MNLEYYYLFGLDIPLESYRLGVIKQPRIIDFINKDIEIEAFYLPFVMNDILINESKNKDELNKLKNSVGSLTFLMTSCYNTNRVDLLDKLIKSIGLLYGCEATIDNQLRILAKDVIIDNSNFDTLCNLALESQRIDKKDIKFNKKEDEELDPISQRFEMFRKMHRDKTKGKNSDLKIIDIFNFIIHSSECSLDYSKILNMTVYQVKNTLETLMVKNNYETMMQYKLSQKFDIKEDVKNWSSKKIVKNSSINRDV